MGNLYAPTGFGQPTADSARKVPIADAAIALGKSTDTIRRMLRDGRLDGDRKGNKWEVVLPPDARRVDSIPSDQVIALLERELERCHETIRALSLALERR